MILPKISGLYTCMYIIWIPLIALSSALASLSALKQFVWCHIASVAFDVTELPGNNGTY